MPYKSYFNWSGGKDSAIALYYAMKNRDCRVDLLFTSVNSSFQRISMHGVRVELLEQQAQAIGLPLQQLLLPEQPTMSEYNDILAKTVSGLKEQGYEHSVFGDIFLEDLRQYREKQLASVGLKTYFPIWQRNTKELLLEFIDLGFKAVLVCVKSPLLDESFAGRLIDHDLLKDLPAEVDPCGENGEFHSFVFDGPIFKEPVQFSLGEKVYREYPAPVDAADSCFSASPEKPYGFWFCDLVPIDMVKQAHNTTTYSRS